MIDIENEVFTRIEGKLRSDYSSIYITGEYNPAPSTFPAVSLIEEDNYEDRRHRDSSGEEKYAGLMYEVNVYSNLQTGRKSQAKEIMKIISDEMKAIGMTRTYKRPIPNKADTSIYRIIARFSAGVDQNKNIYDL